MIHYRCDERHQLVALHTIALPARGSGARINTMIGLIRRGMPLPPIRLRRVGHGVVIVDGTHRVLASLALGFGFVPARIG